MDSHSGQQNFIPWLCMCRYSYSFPFLDTKGIVVVDDDRVGPLYEHTFPPSLAPSLSFVGIPRKVQLLVYTSLWGKSTQQFLFPCTLV